jgi:hypothetical protein
MCNYSSQSLISGMYACVVSIYVPLYIEMEYNQYTLTLNLHVQRHLHTLNCLNLILSCKY